MNIWVPVAAAVAAGKARKKVAAPVIKQLTFNAGRNLEKRYAREASWAGLFAHKKMLEARRQRQRTGAL